MHRPILFFAVLMVTSVAHAHNGVKDPEVMARMSAMERIDGAFKTLVGMARQEIPLHQAKARMARDTIVLHAGKINALFENAASDPKSEALPTIWDNWADFSARSDELTAAAQGLDFKDRAALADTLGRVGSSCRGCHKRYREKK